MVDVLQQGDYRILLGESLKSSSNSPSSSLISIKYNWTPKDGFRNSSGKIESSTDGISLAFGQDATSYEYTGWISGKPDRVQLALIYDKEKAAWVLEKVDTSVDLNIQPGTNVSPDQVKRYAQLQRPQTSRDDDDHTGEPPLGDDDDDEGRADPSNPFDYRHFLDEAREMTETASHLGGSGTPLPGGHTPMSNIPSPLIGASKGSQILTPQFDMIEIIDPTNKEIKEWPDRRKQKAGKAAAKSKTAPRKAVPSKPKITAKPKQAQAKSEARVVDSDSDSSLDVASSGQDPYHRTTNKNSTLRDDDTSEEEEINSSPPANTNKFKRPISRESGPDTDMPDVEDDEEEEGQQLQQIDDSRFLQSDSDSDNDHDVDVAPLILDETPKARRSPSPIPIAVARPKSKPIKATKPVKARKPSMKSQRPRSPSPIREHMDVDEDLGGIAAEIEAAMGDFGADDDVDEEGGHGVGLGIGVGRGSGSGNDDESDISEEE